jgi:membrane protein DedA with SNARE-associated domain
MTHYEEFLASYGSEVLFAAVLVEQLGLPIPAGPLLVTAGALSASGRLDPVATVLLPIAAAVAANLVWYQLGRRRGISVLQLLCRVSLEPDSCVRQTEDVFARHGARSLLVAKFVPGLNTVAPPLAGIFRMRLGRFLLFDAFGAALWVVVYVALGYGFSDELVAAVAEARRLGARVLPVVLGALVLWIVWKFVRRRRFIRRLRVDRITPEELKRKLDGGENVVIVDLRGSLDFEAEPETIPGAIRVAAGALDGIREELARAPEVILYCT